MAFFDAWAETNLLAYELNPNFHNQVAAQAIVQKKRDGRESLATAVPRICEFIRASFDVSMMRNGWNALGWLISQVVPHDEDDPCFQLAVALIDRGCDVNARREDDGSTPLMAWSKAPAQGSVGTGAVLIVERGADLDVCDNQGNTAVHWMAQNSRLMLLRALTQNGWLERANLELKNNAGHTALDLAQATWARTRDPRSREVCELLRVSQQAVEHARPLKLRWLTEQLQIQDLAHIVMGFVDGKERAQ
jgi:hypothetical protein